MTAALLLDTFSYYTTGAIAALTVLLLSPLALTPVGDQVARASNGVRRPTREEYDYIKPMFEEVYQKSGIKKEIELFVSKDNYPNGSAMGTKTVALSRPLLRCTQEEIKAVLAHELGHIKNYDTQIHSICCFLDDLGLIALAAAIGILTFLTDAFKLFFPFLLFVLILKAIQVIINFIIKITYLATRRGMELRADAFAAQLGYREGMIKFLTRVGDTRKTDFFGTHPLNKTRIARLTA